MNINYITNQLKRILDCAKPQGYIICECGMSAIKKPRRFKRKNISYVCPNCVKQRDKT